MTTNERPCATLAEIDEHESWALLASMNLGRFATCAPNEAPVVLPVNFVVDDWVIVFRTGVGRNLLGALRGPASFEVDSYDAARRTGWSVLVRGIAYEASDAEIAHLHVEPWAPGDRSIWLRMVPLEVTGRRIQPCGTETDARGYL